MYCCKDGVSREIKSKADFVRTDVPERADANGFIACAQILLEGLNAASILNKDSVLCVKPVLRI